MVTFIVPLPDILTFDVYGNDNNLLYSSTKAFDRDDAVVMTQMLKGPFIFAVTNGNGSRQYLVR